MVEEARLEQLDAGLTPVTDGWFVVNVRYGAWMTNEALGAAFVIEGEDAPFPDVGFTLAVLQPGQASRYHRESNQEDFLVLAGECPARRGRGAAAPGVGLRPLPGGHRPRLRRDGRGPVRDLHDRRAKGLAGERHRLSALRAGTPPWRGRREGDDLTRRGVRVVPEVGARAAGRLERIALGLAGCG
jgi:hypothetical protein